MKERVVPWSITAVKVIMTRPGCKLKKPFATQGLHSYPLKACTCDQNVRIHKTTIVQSNRRDSSRGRRKERMVVLVCVVAAG